ncbi:MAG: hypothetical protein ABH826_04600 [Patescibacteria group bacterium]
MKKNVKFSVAIILSLILVNVFAFIYVYQQLSVKHDLDDHDFAVLGFSVTPPAFNNGFEIRYIGGVAQLFIFSSENVAFSVLKTEALGSQMTDCNKDAYTITSSETVLGGETACYFEYKAIEYIDGPSPALDQTVPSVRFTTIYDDSIYTLYFPNDTVLSDDEKFIVDSFKFID